MTDTNITTPNPFAAHVALDAQVNAESDRLYCMDRGRIDGRQIDLAIYAEIEDGWWALCQQRNPLDVAVLSVPITDDQQVSYKADVIRRIVELAPDRHDELYGRLAYQVEAWARRFPMAA